SVDQVGRAVLDSEAQPVENRRRSVDMTWERGARAAGSVAAILAIVGIGLAGKYPGPHASAATISMYYADHRSRIFVTIFVLSASILFFYWFLGAIAQALRDAGKGSWAGSAVALGSVRATFLAIHLTINAVLAYDLAANGSAGAVVALHDFTWA